MEDDWDLHAVVRGCAAICTTTTSTSTSAAAGEFTSTTSHGRVFSTLKQNCTSFKDLFQPRRESFVQELHELYRPFFPLSEESSSLKALPSQNLPISPLSVLGGLQDLPSEHHQKQQQQQHLQIMKQLPPPTHLRQKQQAFSVANGSPKTRVISHPPPPRSKRRKNNLKRVCHVAAENLSSDMWSWRKYGQKPIKGSPYPRGYYRCSTSKGCMARKQVERNRSDPGMFIVTYTAEHNHPIPAHRNSLAGSTRNKQPETPSSDDPNKQPTSSSPEKMESSRDDDLAEAAADEDEDDFSISEMALDEDFFAGLEDITATDSGECSGQFSVQLPWLSTITGGG